MSLMRRRPGAPTFVLAALTGMALSAPMFVGTAATAAPVTSRVVPSTATSADVPPGSPLVVGHRGASGYRPEHTLASYELAARMGADFIEPDLVSTKDHVLVARHENEISGTTDVADRPQFANRRKTKVIDGLTLTGWFTEDFTLSELKRLRAKERLPDVRQENTMYDGLYQVPTLQEVLDLRASLSRELGRTIGVFPETKHPTYFRSIGLDLETPLVRQLRAARLDKPDGPVIVQSFELTNLIEMRTELGLRARTAFLTSASGAPYDLVVKGDTRTYADLTSYRGLRSISPWISGIGPDKNQVIPRNTDGTLGKPTAIVRNAHAFSMTVIPYTFRNENQFMPVDYRVGTDPDAYGRAIDEQVRYLQTGIDGLFTDNPDTGVVARDRFLALATAR